MKLNYFMRRKAIVDIIAALLILLFTYTAVNKLMGLESFRITLFQSPLLRSHSDWLYIAIPVAELIIAALLFFPSTKLIGLYASFVLMLGFSMYVAYMLQSGVDLPCSCGGVVSTMNWTQHFYFNIIFTLTALTGAIMHRRNKQHPPQQRQHVLTP